MNSTDGHTFDSSTGAACEYPKHVALRVENNIAGDELGIVDEPTRAYFVRRFIISGGQLKLCLVAARLKKQQCYSETWGSSCCLFQPHGS